MTEQIVSDRRRVVTYDRTVDGELAYIGMWIDDVQVAAAVRQPPLAPSTHEWHLWSSALSFDKARPLLVATESDAQAWLNLIADLAEFGPSALTRRKERNAS